MGPRVLALEPDSRQAAIVKRLVREKVHADVTVVDSPDAALESMRASMPDVLLLSALLSPRDEDDLMAHLRLLEHSGHLQTHTIPQLASALEPAGEKRARGLFASLRRKKAAERAPAGCDPDVFAEEIALFLQHATDKKRELSETGASGHEWRSPGAAQPTPIVREAAAPAAPASSWSSPFEWRPDRSTLATNPESPVANPESRVAHPGSPVAHPDSPIAKPEPLAAAVESPVAEALVAGSEASVADIRIAEPEPSIAHPESVSAVPAADVASDDRVARAALATEPAWPEPEADPAVAEVELSAVASEAMLPAVDLPIEDPDTPEATIEAAWHGTAAETDEEEAAAPAEERRTLDHFDSLLDLAPLVDHASEIDEGFRIDEGSEIGDGESAIQDSGLEMRDPIDRRRLGSLATWTRKEAIRPVAGACADDLRAIIAGLAVPATIASVAYPRGCRIRRVRVPGDPKARLADVPGPVILSKKLLDERRNATANP